MYADHLVQAEKDRIQAEADAELKRVFEKKNNTDEIFAKMKADAAKKQTAEKPNTFDAVTESDQAQENEAEEALEAEQEPIVQKNVIHYEEEKDSEEEEQPDLSYLQYIPQLKVLNVGCGNSVLPEEMYDTDGYRDIYNMDISQLCIDQMKQRNQEQRPELICK